MVFVTLGTQDKEFRRLPDEVLKLVNKGIIKDVEIQVGCTKFESDKMKVYKYLNRDEVLKKMKKCDYIICHGGVGSILDALDMNKKVIAVARLSKYGEHVNDHQLQIIDYLTKNNHILDGTYNLEEQIKKIPTFKPKKYISNNDNFIKIIEDFIDNN